MKPDKPRSYPHYTPGPYRPDREPPARIGADQHKKFFSKGLTPTKKESCIKDGKWRANLIELNLTN